MNKDDFVIGEEFRCGLNRWKCTDIGTRVIVAIELNHEDDKTWYNGPPYAVEEVVFNEEDMKGCERLIVKSKEKLR